MKGSYYATVRNTDSTSLNTLPKTLLKKPMHKEIRFGRYAFYSLTAKLCYQEGKNINNAAPAMEHKHASGKSKPERYPFENKFIFWTICYS